MKKISANCGKTSTYSQKTDFFDQLFVGHLVESVGEIGMRSWLTSTLANISDQHNQRISESIWFHHKRSIWDQSQFQQPLLCCIVLNISDTKSPIRNSSPSFSIIPENLTCFRTLFYQKNELKLVTLKRIVSTSTGFE